jgi:hypothetical protein
MRVWQCFLTGVRLPDLSKKALVFSLSFSIGWKDRNGGGAISNTKGCSR